MLQFLQYKDYTIIKCSIDFDCITVDINSDRTPINSRS